LVDGDLPATYRLPRVAAVPTAAVDAATETVPLFLPPLSPEFDRSTPTMSTALIQTQQTNTWHTPAGSPPDERCDVPLEVQQSTPTIVVPQNVAQDSVPIGPVWSDTLPGTPATTQLASQQLPAVQRGYVLAQRGALFAAKTEFVQVLRRVAQAKDMAADSDEHSQALAAGLRALDEADDFVPDGVQLEAELDVRATASSHRTPALLEQPEKVLPHEAVILYHDFAQEQLAKAVAGEQPGSMALYGLGRIDAQLAQRRDDDVGLVRGAMTMYAAALAACPHNHLAANELGVLECRTGRPAEAVRLFQQTIDFAPTATAYHNLAVAQQKLGLHAKAQANEQESQRLAAWERANGTLSQRAGVQWVAPEEMSRVAQHAALTPPPIHPTNAQPSAKSPWQRTVELARSLPPRGSAPAAEVQPDPTPRTHVVWPASHPTQSRWR
jgi:tetratricopeptide (TPR) repeat protein